MLTRVRSPRSGRPSEGNAVAASAEDRLRGASSAPDSRTPICRHAGSGPKRGGGDGRVATFPRGAVRTANPDPSRPEAQADGQPGGGSPSASVFVLDKWQQPLMPCHQARARQMLSQGRAVVHRLHPFTIRLKDRIGGNTQLVLLSIDPGSVTTGLALSRLDGMVSQTRTALWLAELEHRGSVIRKKLQQRAGYRRRRRSAHLRYRPPRFDNRRRPKGWLPPSLRHRVQTADTWLRRLRRLAPITQIGVEAVAFDTQQMQNPEITGLEYQQGTLFGYEVREYLLHKWGRQCAYCRRTGVPLQIEHLIPTRRGGSDRVSNLTLACGLCNQRKGNQTAEEFGHPHLQAQAQRPLRDATAVSSTRTELVRRLEQTGLPVESATGGRTKWNRTRLGLPKTHALDALCVGTVERVRRWGISTLAITATGRGSYQRTRITASGFPRGYLMRQKTVWGFRTGDMVRAVVPTGKKAGAHTGRVAVRASASFNVQTATGTIQGIASRHCRLLQRGDGYGYAHTT